MLDLATVKEHLRVDGTYDDVIITRYLAAAYAYIEGKMSSPVESSASRVAYFEALGDMELAPKLVSVESITYTDDDGATQTLSTDVYQVVTSEIVGKVVLSHGESWPAHQVFPESVMVTYTAGFTVVPPSIEQAILMYVGHLYSNAESTSSAGLSIVPQAVDCLIAPYVNHRL